VREQEINREIIESTGKAEGEANKIILKASALGLKYAIQKETDALEGVVD
jgi:hypothetical protein